MQIMPRINHRFVQELCIKIVTDGTPVRVPVRPEPDAEVNECFLNVPKKIARAGGAIKHGWCIWELSGLFVEAEFHGVWRSPPGDFVDVTPKVHKETEILFLPDDSASFDEKSFNRRDNIRLAIKNDAVVHEFLKVSGELIKYIEDSTDSTDPRLTKVDRLEYGALLARKAELQLKMDALKIGRNDICRCGSAQKYKKCCGQ
jgi:hypothetical protein